MRSIIAAGLLIALSPAMTGCVSLARTVVTAPVKIVSKSADLLTTSQAEADEKRGRALREQDEKRGALARLREKAAAAPATTKPATISQNMMPRLKKSGGRVRAKYRRAPVATGCSIAPSAG
jgi:hypothetical protein